MGESRGRGALPKNANVVLIGMPGAGKSTVGVVVAKRLGYDFVDTDLLLQSRAGKRLQQIINEEGLDAFRRLEEQVLVELAARRTVIATGGSAVYSSAGMAALKRDGVTVFLRVPLDALERRIRDMDTRGMVIDPGESFRDLYHRRQELYCRWADHTVDAAGRSVEELATRIVALLGVP